MTRYRSQVSLMSDLTALFGVMRQTADGRSVDAMERLIHEGADRDLCRINVLDFATASAIDAENAISAFLHASRLGLFDLTWTMICPGCAGVLDEGATLKSFNRDIYHCSLCASGFGQPTLDDMVEVTFTVSPRIRKIAAHDPDTLTVVEYFRQIFWTSAIDLPEALDDRFGEFTLETLELPPGEKALLSLQLPPEFVIVFDPVTHGTQFIDVKGDATKERQSLTMVFNAQYSPTGTVEMRSGPLRLTLENQSSRRVLPGIWVANHALHDTLAKRKPFLAAKRLLTNQTFRDIYRADTMDIGQRLKITSLTFIFTDLKGSTELYEKVGDIVAYDLVRHHFEVLQAIVASEGGAVVKTIGDAVMATFQAPDRAVTAALRMRDAMRTINTERGNEDLLLKIGIHEGPCLAVTSNDRQDYFGQTVNMAARIQGLAKTRSIFATKSIVDDAYASRVLRDWGLRPIEQRAALRGIADDQLVYEIP
jgi:class 3 adenylate cyclase